MKRVFIAKLRAEASIDKVTDLDESSVLDILKYWNDPLAAGKHYLTTTGGHIIPYSSIVSIHEDKTKG